MAVKDKDFYNEASAQKLGWVPQWFGAQEFGDQLLKKVKEFQKEHGLSPDGLVGPVTFRRAYTELEARRALLDSMREGKHEEFEAPHIVCAGRPVPIEWDKVGTMRDEGSLVLPRNCYKAVSSDRTPTMIVTHWDAALSAASCCVVYSSVPTCSFTSSNSVSQSS